MFTLEQIQEAHRKVTSGADFPVYIQALKKLGVLSYEVFVEDGHTQYYGAQHYNLSAPARYPSLPIAKTSHPQQFKTLLLAHQQGKTNYHTFCHDCATTGIEKWIVSIEKMTCTYYNKEGKEILIEAIPA